MSGLANSEILKAIRDRLHAVHGARLHGVILYGSQARGEATADSDIDVLVLLDGPVDYGRELDKNLKALYPLATQWSRRISAKPIPTDEYETFDCPLYRHAHRDGIAA